MDEIVNLLATARPISWAIARRLTSKAAASTVASAQAEMDRVTQQNALAGGRVRRRGRGAGIAASRLTQAVAVFRIQQQQQRARDVAA